jgi:hypothetical protein
MSLSPIDYSMGSREKAMIAWDILQTAWKKHTEAQVWVIGQCEKKKHNPIIDGV